MDHSQLEQVKGWLFLLSYSAQGGPGLEPGSTQFCGSPGHEPAGSCPRLPRSHGSTPPVGVVSVRSLVQCTPARAKQTVQPRKQLPDRDREGPNPARSTSSSWPTNPRVIGRDTGHSIGRPNAVRQPGTGGPVPAQHRTSAAPPARASGSRQRPPGSSADEWTGDGPGGRGRRPRGEAPNRRSRSRAP